MLYLTLAAVFGTELCRCNRGLVSSVGASYWLFALGSSLCLTPDVLTLLFFSALGHRSCIMGQAVIPISCFHRTIKMASLCRRKSGFLQDFHRRRKSAWKDLLSDRTMGERAGVTQAGIGTDIAYTGLDGNISILLTYPGPPNWIAC